MRKLPSREDLKQLPLRAIVAYAARCARRVEPIYELRSVKSIHKQSLKKAIQLAEAFCEGVADQDVDRVANAANQAVDAGSAADAGRAAAAAARTVVYASRADDSASRSGDEDVYVAQVATAASLSNASRAAAAASQAAAAAVRAAAQADDAVRAAAADFKTLISLGLGRYPDLGQPIDPSEQGPLGPLWPDKANPPERPTTRGIASGLSAHDPRSLKVYIDPGDCPPELITELFMALSAVYRAQGGSGLEIAENDQRLLVGSEVCP